MRILPRCGFYRNNLINIDCRLLAKQLYLSWPCVAHRSLLFPVSTLTSYQTVRPRMHRCCNTGGSLCASVSAQSWVDVNINSPEKFNENISHRAEFICTWVLFFRHLRVTYETVNLVVRQAFITIEPIYFLTQDLYFKFSITNCN